jgi:hypothetical protein
MNVEYHNSLVRTDLYFVANNVLLCCVFCGMVWMCFDGLYGCIVHYIYLYSFLCKVELFLVSLLFVQWQLCATWLVC